MSGLQRSPYNSPVVDFGLIGLIIAAVAFIFWDGAAYMITKWGTAEYNHGYLIPIIAALIALHRLSDPPELYPTRYWPGVLIVCAGVLGYALGELSGLFVIIQYSLLAVFVGFLMVMVGVRATVFIWPALVYLIFMIPLPEFFYYRLSTTLQLVSSQIGVAIVRLFDISVHLEGNIIDLGTLKLQVAEACSGLRYLFPLTSFAYLIAYLYRGPLWQKLVILVSALPITVLLNSVRIGVIGILVEYFGPGQAEGFLHFFEGWVIFIGCLALLYAEVAVLARLSGIRSAAEGIDLELPRWDAVARLQLRTTHWPFAVAGLWIGAGLAFTVWAADRETLLPARSLLSTFPIRHDGWRGEPQALDREILAVLRVDDYLLAEFRSSESAAPVELYVPYYASQEKGGSAHSPRSCLPGGGWQIESFYTLNVPTGADGAQSISVNRAVISLGDRRQLVYYWFKQRERILTSEYLVKWFIFWDGLTRNRTDGALFRLITPVAGIESIKDADRRLQLFMSDVPLQMRSYVPD